MAYKAKVVEAVRMRLLEVEFRHKNAPGTQDEELLNVWVS